MDKTQDHRIVIIGTGGTIAGLAHNSSDSVNYASAVIDIKQLLLAAKFDQQRQVLPTLNAVNLLTEQLVQVDSKDMSFDIWKQLLLRCRFLLSQNEVQAIVITHGTDTLEETAYFLHAMLRTEKPVILTCAMRPSNAHDSDGPQNLRDALTLAAHPRASGVMVVCAGDIHGAQFLQKVHTTRLNAFSSGDAALLGHIIDGKVNLNVLSKHVQAFLDFSVVTDEDIERLQHLPRVEIILNHADANGGIVDALLQQKVSSQQKLRGIVVAGTGNGTISQSLESALMRAQNSGVVVWRSTRCAFGSLVGRTHAEFGDSYGLAPVKARIALMLQLFTKELGAKVEFR